MTYVQQWQKQLKNKHKLKNKWQKHITNNKKSKISKIINKLNFYLEIILTLSVFLSSFLIITLEKDWWGGYLTADHNSQEAHNFKEWLANGKRFKK